MGAAARTSLLAIGVLQGGTPGAMAHVWDRDDRFQHRRDVWPARVRLADGQQPAARGVRRA
jgi:hypothetical protein